jgi:hypothetical protein
MPVPVPAPSANGHAANVPVVPVGTAEGIEYSMLLGRQMALVEGPQNETTEREYERNRARLAKLEAAFAVQ